MPVLAGIQELDKRIYFIPMLKREKNEGKKEFVRKCEEFKLDLAKVLGMTVIVGKGHYMPLADVYTFSINMPENKRNEVWGIMQALAEERKIKIDKNIKIK